MIGGNSRFARSLRKAMPSRESLENNRFIQPVAHRVLAPELWRFTRRSVPRGVALGLLVGILLMIPGVQIASAALLALPVRANVPIAAAMTLFSNPATTPFILGLSYYVGRIMLGRSGDMSAFTALIEHHASIREWAGWLIGETAPVMLFGLTVVSVVTAVVGYFLAKWLWRERMGRKWRTRLLRRDRAREQDLAPGGGAS
jgi:uncharacterized protein (DUF2062 family)